MKRAVLEGSVKVDIADLIKTEATEDTGVITKEIPTKEGKVVVVMYEKYFLRINSDLNVTIFYEENKNTTNVEIISSGGSIGNLIKTSYGAEDRALEIVVDKLTALGFSVKEQA